MADATFIAAADPIHRGTETCKPTGGFSAWIETLSRPRRSSLCSDCSEDSTCSTSGRPSFLSRVSRQLSRTQRRSDARSSEDSASSAPAAPTAPAEPRPAEADMLNACDAADEATHERVGYLLRGSPVRIVAPDEFLDPVTDCLILEPVTLLNTDTTLDRLTLQEWLRAGNAFCPRTHTPLNDWICVRSNDDLRARITEWAEECGIDLDALITAHYAKAACA
ncbi:hypothetical protein WJX81_001671 [Elliptochloris bilobata]|uniref:U-box domain-containing protein n=1 Tax=Elliptochloris bilobata TaxID=381761 RepID=A0AAW1RTA2_9CHLO